MSMVESWLGSVLFVVAASRDELEHFSSVSRSSSTPRNTENMLNVSTFTEVLLLTGTSGADGSCISTAAGVCCLAQSVLNHSDVLPKITDLRFHVFVLFCDLRQLLGQ